MLGSGADRGEGVVDHEHVGRQAAAAERRGQPPRVGGRVRPGQPVHADLRRWRTGAETGRIAQVVDQPGHPLDPRFEADLLVRRRRSAQRSEQPSIAVDEGEIGLRIPAVDGKDHLSTPVTTRPRVKKRWVSRKATTGMISVISVPAWISPGSRKWMPLKRDSPSATVCRSGVPDR